MEKVISEIIEAAAVRFFHRKQNAIFRSCILIIIHQMVRLLRNLLEKSHFDCHEIEFNHLCLDSLCSKEIITF